MGHREPSLQLNKLTWLGSGKGLFQGEDCQLVNVSSHGGKQVPLGALRDTHTQTFTHMYTRMVRAHTHTFLKDLLYGYVLCTSCVHGPCGPLKDSKSLGARATGGPELPGVGVGN